MKYFLDTEFLEGTQKKRILGIPYGKTKNTIDLISVGIVAENGRNFYEISKDFNLNEAWNRYQRKQVHGDARNIFPNGIKEYWIRENVLKPIFLDFLKLEAKYLSNQINMIGYAPALNTQFTKRNFKRLLKKYGKTNKEIAKEIRNFVMVENYDSGGQILLGDFYPNDTPKPEFYAYYADYDWVVFCWIFGKMIDLPKGFPMYCKDLKQMMDEKAESKKDNVHMLKVHPNYPKQKNEHNAFSDAEWNFKLYKFLNTI